MGQALNKRYRQIKTSGQPPLPSIIAIEPTFRCNLSCTACFYKKNHSLKKESPIKKFINFLGGISKLSSVYLPAKEPLMRKDIFELFSYLHERNVPIWLLTNGTLINKNNYSKISYNKNNTVMVSLDGDKKIHNRARGSSLAYGKTVEAIRLLKNKCNLYVVCIISEKNLYHLWKMPQIISSLGLDRVIFEYERKYARKDLEDSYRLIQGETNFFDLRIKRKNTMAYSYGDLRVNIEKMEREAERYKVRISYLPSYFKEEMFSIYHREIRKKLKLTCHYLNKTRIDPCGNYMHCFALRQSFGNILTSSLEEVWYSQKYINFRKNLLGNNLLPVCDNCWGAIPVNSKYEFHL